MHYSLFRFTVRRLCYDSSCQTLHLKNAVEYRRQGSPHIGQRKALSARDIEQVNRLYLCPGMGTRGIFQLDP